MSNTHYYFIGNDGHGVLPDETEFLFDAEDFDKIKDINWYRCYRNKANDRRTYITTCRGVKIHVYLLGRRDGMEVDHINLDTFDNRKANLRFCTHQQNQCNQPLQSNNTSGVSGVSFYKARHKYRARVKASGHDIHLGYYDSFDEAVQARNEGMKFMFGEYGRYNDVPPAPCWIQNKVKTICERFSDLAVSGSVSLCR